MNARAADREARVFARFAERSPIRIIPASIESRIPPKPDIVCALESGERVAFELVELIDEQYARGMSELARTKRMLDELKDRLPKDLRTGLLKRHPRGVFISFDISIDLPIREREAAAIDVLRVALTNEWVDGHFHPEGELGGRIPTVHVHPWERGVAFDAGLSSRLSDPTLERLASKFAKAYRSDDPIELLMYTELDLLYPDDIWRAAVEPYIRANLERSPFRRVWLLKTAAGTIDFIYPPPD